MNNAPVLANSGLGQSFAIQGLIPAAQAQRMNMGGTATALGPRVKISMVKAEHSSELIVRNPATGKDDAFIGDSSAGFVIEFENGFKLWHMGDTGVFGDMKLIADMYRPDLVLLPIGGGQVQMNPQQAAMVTKDFVKAKAVIPIDYGTSPGLTGTPAALIQAMGDSTIKVMVVNPGEIAEF